MPNQPATPKLNFRYPEEKTEALQRIADDMRVNLSDVLRLACDRLIRDYPGLVESDPGSLVIDPGDD